MKSEGGLEVCEQVIEELVRKFQLPVDLNDFDNDVDNVRTNFTVAIASAFGVEPTNITLTYYAAEGTRNTLRQSRRLLQNTAPATIVETRITVFQSKSRPTATQVTAILTLSLPNVLILELQMSTIQVTPVPTADTPFNSIWYIVGAGAFTLFMFIVCMAVCIQMQGQTHPRYAVYDPDGIQYHKDGYVQDMDDTTQSYYPPPYTTPYT